MFVKDEHKIKLINRDGLELSGYYNKTTMINVWWHFVALAGIVIKHFAQSHKNVKITT